jgi:hypothetical protein
VVDLPGQWTYDGPEKVKLPAKNAEALRVGLHDDKLRVVVDFAAGQKPVEPEARPVPHGLLLVLPIP